MCACVGGVLPRKALGKHLFQASLLASDSLLACGSKTVVMAFSRVCFYVPISPFYKDIGHSGLETTEIISFYLDHFCEDSTSKGHLHRYPGWSSSFFSGGIYRVSCIETFTFIIITSSSCFVQRYKEETKERQLGLGT